MKKIFITGSTQGLGYEAGLQLLKADHQVIFHARSEITAKEASAHLKDAVFVIGDVSTLAGMKSVAEQVNQLGTMDAIIHNVGVYTPESFTADGFRTLFAVNVLAEYVLSVLINKPERMIFLCSGMHLDGKDNLEDLQWKNHQWNSTQAYSDSKLYIMMLTKWFAKKWPSMFVNAVDPGWVPTRMGGASAPDDLFSGVETQAWLAVSNEANAKVSGKYFYHKAQKSYNPLADNQVTQDNLVQYLVEISGIK